MEHIRSWRAGYHKTHYHLGDYLSRKVGQLRRVDLKSIRMKAGSLFSENRLIVFRLDLASDGQIRDSEVEFSFRKISAVEAIRFACRLHRSNSPEVWSELLKRELGGK